MHWSTVQDDTLDDSIGGFSNLPGDPIDEFISVASLSRGAAAQSNLVLCFNSEVNGQDKKWDCWPSYPPFDFELHGELYERLETLKSCYVVIEMVPLHVSRSDAIESEVFGLLGEESIVLISPTDKCALQEVYNLWLTAPPEFDPAPQKFFQTAVEEQSFQKAVQYWQYELRVYWLRFKSAMAIRNGTLRQEEVNAGGSSMWYCRKEWEKSERPNHPGSYYQAGPGANWEGLFDEAHPFVLEVMETMPRFEPMIMFRFCEKNCYEPE